LTLGWAKACAKASASGSVVLECVQLAVPNLYRCLVMELASQSFHQEY